LALQFAPAGRQSGGLQNVSGGWIVIQREQKCKAIWVCAETMPEPALILGTSGEPRPASDVSELAWFAPHELPSDLAFRSNYQALEDWQRAMRGDFTPMALTSENPLGHPEFGETD
jgi:hypothetical protein